MFAVGTALSYGYRAYKAMNENEQGPKVVDVPQSDVPTETASTTVKQPICNVAAKQNTVRNSVGLDIGSSHARVAVRSDGVSAVLINSDGKRQTPVEILLSSFDGQFVTGNIAKIQRWAKPGAVSSSVHLSIGMNVEDFLSTPMHASLRFPAMASEDKHAALEFKLGSSTIAPHDAYYRVTKYICDHCSPAVNSLRLPCVLAVPTFFNDAQKTAAVKALRRTGLAEVNTLADSICAVIGANETGLWSKLKQKPDLILVIDVGGGYSQLSLVEQKADKLPKLVACSTLFGIGGEAIDTLVVNSIADKFKYAHGIDLMSDPMALQRLYDAVEGSKLELSNKFNSRVNIPFVSASASGPIHLDETYSRASFDNIISPVVSKLSPSIESFLDEAVAQWTNTNLDKKTDITVSCLLVGGGARVACVQDQVASAVKKAIRSAPLASLVREGNFEMVMMNESEELVILGAAEASKYD